MNAAMEAVVRRIQKLRRLSESSNVHEAASAAAEAQRLMTEHRIAEASLGDPNAGDEPIVDQDVLSALGWKRGQVNTWEAILAQGLAGANGCKTYKQPKWKGHANGGYHVVGRQQDVDAVKYLFVMIRREVELMALAWRPGREATSARTAFKHGAAVAVRSRLLEDQHSSQAKLKAAASMGSQQASTALIVLDRALAKADEHVKRVCAGGKTFTFSGPSSMEGFRAGQAAGSRLDLGRGKKAALGSGPKQIGGAS